MIPQLRYPPDIDSRHRRNLRRVRRIRRVCCGHQDGQYHLGKVGHGHTRVSYVTAAGEFSHCNLVGLSRFRPPPLSLNLV